MLKRLIFFAYGLVAYVIFVATFLYAIAFVGGFGVSRRLDGPLQTSLLSAIAIDCALLTVFAAQHSIMARRWFKERWTQVVVTSTRLGLPAFYTLHVWAWKESPTGTFVNWNHNVSCDAFGG